MIKITDTIYLLPGKNNGRFPYCNCIYIKDDICALIDSAAGDENLTPVLGRVDILISSHFHPDHVRGHCHFPKARILCHGEDTPALQSYEEMLRYTGYDRFTPEWIAQVMSILDHRPSRVDKRLSDNEILDFGRTKLRVIHTPGHTPGHCCFYEEKTGLLFGADIDLTAFGPWYAHQCSDLEAYEKSMEKVINLRPVQFISGHENVHTTENVTEKLQNYADVFNKRDQMILKELKLPHTLDELASKKLIYSRHPDPSSFFYYFEWQMIKKHLEKLQRIGSVTRTANEKLIAIEG